MVGAHAVALRLELGAQHGVVVDLAVLHHVDGSVLIGYRLVTCHEVDDRQSPGSQPDGPVHDRAGAVRAAVAERGVHRLERVAIGAAVGGDQSADAAHR